MIAALLVASAAAGVKSASAAWIKLAVWEMNEPPGATIMHDSSGNHRSGLIGALVTTGVVDGSYTGYQFQSGPKDENRLVIADRPALNPKRHVFSIFLRFKTSAMDENIIQKGQANTNGGSWKIEVDNEGHLVCTYRGAAGRGAIRSRGSVADGQWHKATCTRRPDKVVIQVGNNFPRSEPGPTGNIENAAKVSIGGKFACDAPAVSCQYFDGLVDRVAIRRQ